ncbi:MAG: thiol peroxidase [Bowdeniella nasicola]|nr:thiol peroxidase [Bowdeniella nasicola]
MATTHFHGEPTPTSGALPQVGDKLPDFELVGLDLAAVTRDDFAGKKLVLNIFPSVDTDVCANSVRRFNHDAAALSDVNVLCISKDLPFALDRFCGAEGIDKVTVASAFRSTIGDDLGLILAGSPLAGLLARAVITADAEGTITSVQLVDEITTEPDYDAALQVLD